MGDDKLEERGKAKEEEMNVRYKLNSDAPIRDKKKLIDSGYKTGLLIATYAFAALYDDVTNEEVQKFVDICDELLMFAEKHVDKWQDMNKFLRDYTGRDIVFGDRRK